MRRIPLLRIVALLEQFGLQVTPAPVATPLQALYAARNALTGSPPPFQRIIVAGGDGSINAVVPAFVEIAQAAPPASPVSLAVLPVGSVNVLARELTIPLALREAARIAAQGSVKRIDLGLFNKWPFVLMAGLGYDAAAVHAVKEPLKRRIGVLAYALNGLQIFLGSPARKFHITYDGQSLDVEAWQIVVTNVANYSYRWTMVPQARLDDGRLDICILPELGAFQRVLQASAVMLRRHHLVPLATLVGRHIEVQVDAPVAVQLDGDPFPPVEQALLEVLPGCLNVVVPPVREAA